jgi:hypothetical protein
MSNEIGRVRGRAHETAVSVSRGGVELGIWPEPGQEVRLEPKALDRGFGYGDSFDATRARGLAALLIAAADEHDRRFGVAGRHG